MCGWGVGQAGTEAFTYAMSLRAMPADQRYMSFSPLPKSHKNESRNLKEQHQEMSIKL